MDIPHVYLNGHIVPLAEAAISPLDIGLLRGYAVFDLLRTVGGRPFLLTEHLKRLRASADELNLKVPVDDATIAQAIERLLELNQHAEATVRLLLTGGVSPDGRTASDGDPTFLILTHELQDLAPNVYEDSVGLMLVEHARELPQAKSTNYLTMLKRMPDAKETGNMSILYHKDGRISEAASASFYIVKDEVILAPSAGVLYGTVGPRILALAEKSGHRVIRGQITLDDALAADEAFITSTTRGVVPIVRLSQNTIGTGRPGPVTRKLIGLFKQLLQEAYCAAQDQCSKRSRSASIALSETALDPP
ncbi:MAG: aminotransferase class IV [Coriobacteriia bacterium]|nr:aminotransferase class IV [Coriobacteriia bacterium]